MAWTPTSVTIGGETFVEADFAPFAFAATWPRFLEALRQHAVDVGELAGIQQAGTVGGTGSAYTFTPAAPLLAGQGLWFRPNVNNLGACTADGIPIKRSNGSDPAADELVGGTEYLLRYDGTNLRVLSLNVALAALSRLTPAADALPYFTAAAGAALATFTSFGRSLVAQADDEAARGVLGAQAADPTLTALAALAWASGAQVPVLTGADTFALRTIGAAAGSNLLDRDAGDGRFLNIAMVQVATNIATSDNIAYTYDTPFDVPEGGILIWKHPSANAASSSITAARNPSGTPLTIRNSDGQQIATAGLMRGGRTAILRREGSILVNATLDVVQWLFSRMNLVGASATIDGVSAADQTTVLSRIGGFSTGAIFGQVSNGAGGLTTAFWAYENGNSAGRPAYQFRVFNDLAVDGALSIGGFSGRVNMLGATATLDGRATSGDPVVSRIGGLSAGSIFGQVSDGAGGRVTAFYAYGAGNAALRPVGEFRTFYDLRVEGNLTVVGTVNAVLPTVSIDAPAQTDQVIQLMEEFGGTAAYETLAQTRAVANTFPHQIAPSDFGRHLWDNVNGSFIDCGDMLNHETKLINVGTAGTVSIWTGEAVNFTDRAVPQVRVSKGRYRVHRGQGNEWEIEAVNGKTITDAPIGTYPLPVYNRRIAVLGYSNGVRTMKNIAGWRDQFLAWGEDPSVVNIISGVGASCFLEGGESGFVDGNAGTYNHWWKWRTSAPGPNITTFLDAVAAQPSSPAMEFVFIHLGYPDMNLFEASRNPLGAALTEAQMVGHWADALAYIKGPSGLNLPGLKFIICPMAHRHVAVWPRNLWYALRRMHLQVCADHPTLAVRGPDSFDVRYIPADGHPTIRSQAIFSRRWARWSESIAERKSIFLCPEIVDFIRDSTTQCRVVIDPKLDDAYAIGTGEALRFPGYEGNWNSAPVPPGLALLPPGTDYWSQDPIEITNVKWSYASSPAKRYTITVTHAATANVRLCWPYGFMNECGEDPSRCIRSALTGEPLATYHPDVPVPTYLP